MSERRDKEYSEYILTGPDRAVDPVTETDLARMIAIVFTPGVINGIIVQETPEGTWEYNFDDTIMPSYPRVRFFPHETSSD